MNCIEMMLVIRKKFLFFLISPNLRPPDDSCSHGHLAKGSIHPSKGLSGTGTTGNTIKFAMSPVILISMTLGN